MSWDLERSCGGQNQFSAFNLCPEPRAASAVPALGARARYNVQGSNRCFTYSSELSGTHASVGRYRGDNHVEINTRQATGASEETTSLVPEADHLEGDCVYWPSVGLGNQPIPLMMRTLSFGR